MMVSRRPLTAAACVAVGLAMSASVPALAQTYSFSHIDAIDPDNTFYGGGLNGHTWSASGDPSYLVVSVDGEVLFEGPEGTYSDSQWQQLYDALGIGSSATKDAAESTSSSVNRIGSRTLVSNVTNRVASLARMARGLQGDQNASMLGDSSNSVTGLSGGDSGDWISGKLGVWAEGSRTMFSDDNPADAFWGSQMSFMGGADYRFTDDFFGGASLGIETVSIEFDSVRTHSITYVNSTVYGAYLMNDVFSVTGLFSYAPGINAIDQNNTDDGDYVSHRFITAANVAYNNVFDRVTTFGNVGLSYSHETFGSFETGTGETINLDDSQLAQLYGSGDVGYMFDIEGGVVEPFVSTRLEYDFVSTGGNDRFGAVVGGGVRANWFNEGLFLEAFGNTDVARSNETATTFGLNVRVQF